MDCSLVRFVDWISDLHLRMSHDHCQAPGLSDYEPMDPLTNLERVADYVGNPGCCALEHSDVQGISASCRSTQGVCLNSKIPVVKVSFQLETINIFGVSNFKTHPNWSNWQLSPSSSTELTEVIQVAQDEETLERMASAPALNHERYWVEAAMDEILITSWYCWWKKSG